MWMTEMDKQMNVDQSMEENLLWKKRLENILNLGYRPHYVMEAITSIYACGTEITEKMILEHLMIIKREKNLTDEQMKFSTAYEMHESRDLAEMRRENRKMLRMLLCKSCKIYRGAFVNVKCGHLLCSNCRNKLTACKLCRVEIIEVEAVKFGK